MANRLSDCAGNGGDLGQFQAGTIVQEFEDAIRNLAPGERTGSFRTPFGFHIAELRAKRPAEFLELSEVEGDIRKVLSRISEHREYLRVIGRLRAQAQISWLPEPLNNVDGGSDALLLQRA